MLTIASIIAHIIEGIAITAAIYLVTQKSLKIKEIAMLSLTITATFLVLDLFAPAVAGGARQGSGFGLGYTQFAGMPTMPRSYFDPKVVEGMDDPVAIDYYNKLNPQIKDTLGSTPDNLEDTQLKPNLIVNEDTQIPSVVHQEYTKNPFDNISLYAPYPN